jgi:hypothetical protein
MNEYLNLFSYSFNPESFLSHGDGETGEGDGTGYGYGGGNGWGSGIECSDPLEENIRTSNNG